MNLSGWTIFAGVLMVMAGMFGAINGLIALFNDEAYLVTENHLVAFDFTQWGWIHLIAGGILILAGLAVGATGATWARILGVIVAGFHALSQFGFIEAYPFWTLTILALDVVVIYGLLVHGEEIEAAGGLTPGA